MTCQAYDDEVVGGRACCIVVFLALLVYSQAHHAVLYRTYSTLRSFSCQCCWLASVSCGFFNLRHRGLVDVWSRVAMTGPLLGGDVLTGDSLHAPELARLVAFCRLKCRVLVTTCMGV